MKMCRLIRVELFRFYRFLGAFFVMLALFLFSLYLFAAQGDTMGAKLSSPREYLYMAVGMGNLLVPLLACVMIGVYVGREFDRKTIHYEIMQGYGYVRICFAKMITCGMIAPIAAFVCTVLFVCFAQEGAGAYRAVHFAVMLLLMLRVFGCSLLYVMLMESGIYGGIFAFIRYTILDEVLLLLQSLHASKILGGLKFSVSFLAEWGMAADGSRVLEGKEAGIMLAGAIAEWLLLVVLIYGKDRRGIKER